MATARDERLRRLAQALEASGPRRFGEAADALGCSAMTIRRDVAAAPERFSTLGGFVVPASAGAYRIERESDVNVAAKAAIGARAAKFLGQGETIFVDCGATTPHFVRAIPPGLKVTVVTYGLNVANAVAANPDLELVLLGGHYNSSSASFAIEDPPRALAHFGVMKAFLSAGGIHAARGATCSNFHEAPVKRAAIAAALERFLLADASKFGAVKRVAFADIKAFDHVIVAPRPQPGEETAALGARLIAA
jgi:DeoR family deoxyribose operon repressor